MGRLPSPAASTATNAGYTIKPTDAWLPISRVKWNSNALILPTYFFGACFATDWQSYLQPFPFGIDRYRRKARKRV